MANSEYHVILACYLLTRFAQSGPPRSDDATGIPAVFDCGRGGTLG
ncbi:hypothetical protein [Halosaccharopolyspora lacisalsi]|nr:hypothetical protein [Halosaccharopolyspora lacisalsi]